MENQLPMSYLTKKQAVKRYPFLSENMLKNLLFKNIGNFRSKVAKKVGHLLFLDEEALLRFFSESSSESSI